MLIIFLKEERMFKDALIGLLLTTVLVHAEEDRSEIKELSSPRVSIESASPQEMLNETAHINQFLPLIKEKAAQEDPVACFQLASFYYQYDPQARAAEIVRLYTIAAEAQHIDSCYILGMAFYGEQLGLKKTDARLVKYLMMAAEGGNSEAVPYLALAYLHGFGVEKNIQTAIEWLNKAVEHDHVVGLCTYGVLLRAGEEIEPDYQRAKEYFERAVTKEYAYAMTQLGVMHQFGEIGEVNIPEAVRLYEQAIITGGVQDRQDQALLNLGMLYLEGAEIEQNIDKAERYLTDAADWGNRDAQRIIGTCLVEGQILEKRTYSGLTYLARAVAQGDELASKLLDIEKNSLILLAHDGHKEAQRVLGICLMDDTIFKKDLKRGLGYIRMAAEQGNELAFSMLLKLQGLS
jgi:TPR repeat protein